jgi:polysaccharide export outer membrane protein
MQTFKKHPFRISILLSLGLTFAAPAFCQPAPAGQDNSSGQNSQGSQGGNQGGQNQSPTRELPADAIRPNYTLGVNDQILIRCPQADEINEKPFRIDTEGFVNMPLVGRIHLAGMTIQETEEDLVKRLREYIRDPQVIVSVTQFRNEPVFFVGAFNRPGIYALQGGRTLVEMLASIGGTQPNASRHLTVTRRAEYGAIPLPNALVDDQKKISTVEISIGSLRNNVNPAEDILLQPYDVISIERAEQVYVGGEVGKVSGIELGERDYITVAQVLSMAGGYTKDAAKEKARILRPVLNTNRRYVIEVDLKAIFEGKANDEPLLPNDILYVPRSWVPNAWRLAGQVILPIIPYTIFLAAQ